jgi:hypothetical protein
MKRHNCHGAWFYSFADHNAFKVSRYFCFGSIFIHGEIHEIIIGFY